MFCFKNRFYGGILLIMSYLIVSCEPINDCNSEYNQFLKIAFFNKTTGEADSLAFEKISALGTDSAFHNSDKQYAILDSLPLNTNLNSTTFTFELEGFTAQSIIINYKKSFTIIDESCSPVVQIYDISVAEKTDLFDSLEIAHTLLNKNNAYNIKVYLD